MTIFERVKEISQGQGMSLQQVATQAGMGINSLYGWKNKNPSINNVVLVARVLGVSVDALVNDQKEAQTNMTTKNEAKVEDEYVRDAQAYLVGEQFEEFARNYKLTTEEGQDLVEDIADFLEIRSKRIVERRSRGFTPTSNKSKSNRDYAVYHLAWYLKIVRENHFSSQEKVDFLEEASEYLESRAKQIVKKRDK